MITKATAFKTSDEKTHATLDEAQRHEIRLLLGTSMGEDVRDLLVDQLFANREKILDVLTTTESSRAKARKVNGGKKTRTPKTNPQQELPKT